MGLFSGIRVCIVANLASLTGGIPILTDRFAKHLEEEGAVVYRVCKERHSFLKPAATLLGVLRVVQRSDIIQVHCGSYWSFFRAVIGIVVGKMFGKSVIIWYWGGDAHSFLSRSRWFAVPALKAADAVVVPSDFMQEVFAKHGVETQIIPNPFDSSHWYYRERSQISPKLLVVKHLEPIYGIDTVIRAYALVKQNYPEAMLTIVGSGSQEQDLKAMVRELSLPDVTFSGFINHTDLQSVYDDADVFLSGSRVESLGIVLLEAAASGLPIVATRVGGVPGIIEDGKTGLLVEVDDHAAMADSIMCLLRNEEQVQLLVRNAYELVKSYTWGHQRLNWWRLYDSLSNLSD